MIWNDAKVGLPFDGDVFDVWQEWIDERGKKQGQRITNCWMHNRQVLHGKNQEVIRYWTYWMKIEKPNEQ